MIIYLFLQVLDFTWYTAFVDTQLEDSTSEVEGTSAER